ncbi:translation initiation factor IF-2-like [Hyaena hyaena]|uniref:translation initiation factor IF-2-like n=1 Tax=Hyaena hyaena TaxID=95912 RepID=UPI001920FC4D|nr:translation initiation factor IF-2-like [Hyaena hyaena]
MLFTTNPKLVLRGPLPPLQSARGPPVVRTEAPAAGSRPYPAESSEGARGGGGAGVLRVTGRVRSGATFQSTNSHRGPAGTGGSSRAARSSPRPAASGSRAAAAAARDWGRSCAHAGSALPRAHARPGPLGPPPPPPPGRPRPRAPAGPRGCGAPAVSAHMEARGPALRSAAAPPRARAPHRRAAAPPPSPAEPRGPRRMGERREARAGAGAGLGRPRSLAVCAPSPPRPRRGLGRLPGHFARPETLSLWIFVLIFNRAPSSDVAGRAPGHVPRANGRGAARPRDEPAAARRPGPPAAPPPPPPPLPPLKRPRPRAPRALRSRSRLPGRPSVRGPAGPRDKPRRATPASSGGRAPQDCYF